ncbi:MAG TPA: hypothetical protein VFV15_02255 [Moraxellaceae bacterium]|nr:hypothetical protein [Moraxellaceae bacterium]
MNQRIAALCLAVGLATGASIACAEGSSAPAAKPAAPAAAPVPPQDGHGPMMGGGGPGKGPMAGRRMMRETPESFTEESVRTMADGRVIKRRIEQKASAESFSRKEVITNPEGKTATRTITATLNKDKNTWTRKVEGKDFNGETWSRSREVPAMHGPDGDDDAAPEAPAQRPAKAERKK